VWHALSLYEGRGVLLTKRLTFSVVPFGHSWLIWVNHETHEIHENNLELQTSANQRESRRRPGGPAESILIGSFPSFS
jgi:hypothetical protein